MQRKHVDQLLPGDRLGRALMGADGSVLLQQGVRLNPPLIAAIRRRGFMSVSVRDPFAVDDEPDNIVSVQVRAQAAATVRRLFSGLTAAAVTASCDDLGKVGSVAEAIRRMEESPLELDQETAGALAAAHLHVDGLIQQILSADSIGSLESLKTHNEYTFQHSVDVAITGALLGHELGMEGTELQNLVLGCLFHDIGKMFVEVAILDKPGPLTPPERAQASRHPEMGFEILRRLPLPSILPAHVAYQHHERQDGGGYPRGLVGANAVTRSSAEHHPPGRMLLAAEIAAVADVHSALTSDRSYRPALPADRVDRMLGEMAGGHLNRTIVQALRRIAPLYPVGSWVEVTAGRAELVGWRGVVIDVPEPRRPVVRLLLDARGEARTGGDVDLSADDQLLVRSLPPSADPASDVGRARGGPRTGTSRATAP